MIRLLIAALLAFGLGAHAAEGEHKHDTKTFASVAAGLAALDAAVAAAKSKAAAGDFEALHGISEDLHGIAAGLEKRLADVAAENRERFRFNVGQVENLHAQLEAAHDSKVKADVDRVVKRLEDVAGRLKALAPAP
jgi:hypothetical protein